MSKATRATAALDKAGIGHGLHAYDYSAEVESKGMAAAQALGIASAQMPSLDGQGQTAHQHEA